MSSFQRVVYIWASVELGPEVVSLLDKCPRFRGDEGGDEESRGSAYNRNFLTETISLFIQEKSNSIHYSTTQICL